MGEARNRREKFFRRHAFCVFCGGNTKATTEDHYPPKALFRGKHWPVGFNFPACEACNSGSREADRIVAFLARCDPFSEVSEVDREEAIQLTRAIGDRHLSILEGMLLSVTEKRRRARELGIRPADGETHADLGIANVPEAVHAAVQIFALKLTKALHYLHARQIVPVTAAIRFRWFTNADLLRDGPPIPDAFVKMLRLPEPLRRNGADLRDQFDYLYAINREEGLAAFACTFRRAFAFMSVLSIGPDVLERAVANAKAATGDARDVFRRIQ